MKLLFDLHSLRPPRTGIARYTENLIAGLANHPAVHEIVGIYGHRLLDADDLRRLLRGPTDAPPSAGRRRRLIAGLRRLPGAYAARESWLAAASRGHRRALAGRGFIYHETNFVPRPYKGPLVMTVHDLSHVRHPEFHPPERVAFLNRRLPPALARAAHVIVDSAFVRDELLEVYRVPPERISVTHLGVDPGFRPRPESELRETLGRWGLGYQGYVLAVATLEPRKNLSRLLKAYHRLPPALSSSYPLVLTGPEGWRNAELMRHIAQPAATGRVILTGYVDPTTLQALYAGAAMFAYPSLYEGFGLPVVEAFAAGAPVLTSRRSSLPEVAAGAAVEVDPLSVEALAEGLEQLLCDSRLAQRCRERGLARAAQLSWSACVENTLGAYRAAAAG